MSKLLKGWMLVMFVILLASLVTAIGITPGRTMITFEPKLEQEVPFTVINTEHKAMKVVMRIEGELAEYITLDQLLADFKPGEETKSFKYKLKLPGHIDQPGDHGANIIATELPPDADKPGTFIGLNPAVATQLLVQVPYPGKYAEVRLDIIEASVNETVTFTIPVLNFGTAQIAKASSEIEIRGPTNEVIARVRSDELSIDSKQRRELVAYWKANVNPGLYHATAIVSYDGKETRAEKTFNIGSLSIDVTNVEVNNFQLGGIAKFDIDVLSNWNEKLSNVYAQMIIYDENNNEIGNFKSVSIDLESKGRGKLEAYWDTTNVKAGNYQARLILNYDGKTLEKTVETEVTLTGIKTSLTTGRAINPKGESFIKQNSVLVIAIIVLIGINIGWFIYTRKRKLP